MHAPPRATGQAIAGQQDCSVVPQDNTEHDHERWDRVTYLLDVQVHALMHEVPEALRVAPDSSQRGADLRSDMRAHAARQQWRDALMCRWMCHHSHSAVDA